MRQTKCVLVGIFMGTVRIATYNVHKCRGLDGRVRPERIVRVLRELDADILALQEVVGLRSGDPRSGQARYFARELGYRFVMGETRRLAGAPYGNLLLSRFAIHSARNYDISAGGREPRGCLRADVVIDGSAPLHVFNVHLGTSFFERRRQARRLVSGEILGQPGLAGSRVVLGDFNEWTNGLVSRLLAARLLSADIERHLGRRRTYPGVLPFLHLDHIYFDPHFELVKMALHKSRAAMIASDHLPLLADLRARPASEIPADLLREREGYEASA
jgi:endonuclease/exonuclease/phosphatase family metal-dependent hydrolase